MMTTSNNIIGKVYSDFQKNEGYSTYLHNVYDKFSDRFDTTDENMQSCFHDSARDFYEMTFFLIKKGHDPYKLLEESFQKLDKQVDTE